MAQVRSQLGVRRMRLLTNTPKKIVGLEGHGLAIVARAPIEIAPTDRSLPYLRDKRDREGHMLGSAALEERGASITPAAAPAAAPATVPSTVKD